MAGILHDMGRTLSRDEARGYYDRAGSMQDLSRFFEDPATDDLVAHGAFAEADAVVEFGCGTGRFAEMLLDRQLPGDARYLALDQSTSMIGLASERLRRFGERVRVVQTDGTPRIDAPDGCFARFVSNYVFDLLSEEDMRAVLGEAHRVLRPEGLLGLANLAPGTGAVSRLFERGWTALHSLRPAWVGGCRPIEPEKLLAKSDWEVRYARRLSVFGVPSQVLVARRV